MREKLDVAAWSLSLPLVVPLAALGACSIPTEPGAADSASSSDTMQDTDGTGPCEVDGDCAIGYVCYQGMCQYQGCGGCSCAHARPDGDRFRCPGGYYECFVDYDCYEGICVGGQCVEDPAAAACELLPSFAAPISLTFTDPDPAPITKLFFATSGDAQDELVSVRGTTLTRHTPEGQSVVITELAEITDAVAADVDADGALDFVVATGGESPSITMWRRDGDVFVPNVYGGFAGAALQVAVGDWQADGLTDLFLRTADAVLLAPGLADGSFDATAQLTGRVDRMHVVDVDLAGGSEIVVAVDGMFDVLAFQDGTPLLDVATAPLIGTTVADFDGDGFPELLAVQEPFRVLTRFGPLLGAGALAATDLPATAVAVTSGLLGHTAQSDLVVARGDGTAAIYYGGAPAEVLPDHPFECTAELALPVVPTMMAIGDYDDTSRGDVAVSDGNSIFVFAQ